MKRTLQAGILAAALLAVALPASAHRYDKLRDGHILRLMAYGANALGVAAEFTITRPLHWLSSQDNMDIIMGHEAYVGDDGSYFEWVDGNWEPSIAHERQARSKTTTKMVK